jgi:hypothetical protein
MLYLDTKKSAATDTLQMTAMQFAVGLVRAIRGRGCVRFSPNLSVFMAQRSNISDFFDKPHFNEVVHKILGEIRVMPDRGDEYIERILAARVGNCGELAAATMFLAKHAYRSINLEFIDHPKKVWCLSIINISTDHTLCLLHQNATISDNAYITLKNIGTLKTMEEYSNAIFIDPWLYIATDSIEQLKHRAESYGVWHFYTGTLTVVTDRFNDIRMNDLSTQDEELPSDSVLKTLLEPVKDKLCHILKKMERSSEAPQNKDLKKIQNHLSDAIKLFWGLSETTLNNPTAWPSLLKPPAPSFEEPQYKKARCLAVLKMAAQAGNCDAVVSMLKAIEELEDKRYIFEILSYQDCSGKNLLMYLATKPNNAAALSKVVGLINTLKPEQQVKILTAVTVASDTNAQKQIFTPTSTNPFHRKTNALLIAAQAGNCDAVVSMLEAIEELEDKSYIFEILSYQDCSGKNLLMYLETKPNNAAALSKVVGLINTLKPEQQVKILTAVTVASDTNALEKRKAYMLEAIKELPETAETLHIQGQIIESLNPLLGGDLPPPENTRTENLHRIHAMLGATAGPPTVIRSLPATNADGPLKTAADGSNATAAPQGKSYAAPKPWLPLDTPPPYPRALSTCHI